MEALAANVDHLFQRLCNWVNKMLLAINKINDKSADTAFINTVAALLSV
jgi:hypothetical protein